MKLRIGEIRYANCTPLYYTMKRRSDCAGYVFVPGEPAALNRMLASGEVDVSSSSSIEFARHCREYLIIPEISISSTGNVGSILLFSKKPVEELGRDGIAVSSASATSTVLLKTLMKAVYNSSPVLIPKRPVLSEMLDGSDAALLIGDEALKERNRLDRRSGLFVYDLGGMWRDYAGLPFVYALWMVRESSASRMPELAERFRRDLLMAKDVARGSYPEIAAGAAEAGWMGSDGLVAYWEAMSYDLGDAHIRGLMKFYELALMAGEIDEIPSLRFL